MEKFKQGQTVYIEYNTHCLELIVDYKEGQYYYLLDRKPIDMRIQTCYGRFHMANTYKVKENEVFGSILELIDSKIQYYQEIKNKLLNDEK